MPSTAIGTYRNSSCSPHRFDAKRGIKLISQQNDFAKRGLCLLWPRGPHARRQDPQDKTDIRVHLSRADEEGLRVVPADFPVTRENTGSSAQRPEHPSANRVRGPSLPLRTALRYSPKAIAIFLPAWLCSPILIRRFWPQTQHTVNAAQVYQCKLEGCLKLMARSVHSISPRHANPKHEAIAKQRKWQPAWLHLCPSTLCLPAFSPAATEKRSRTITPCPELTCWLQMTAITKCACQHPLTKDLLIIGAAQQRLIDLQEIE